MTDITELAQSHELLIANGQQTADLLRHLADNEIDSDYFAVVSECESYGKETDAELSITEFALRAAGYVDELVEALEKARKSNAFLKGQLSELANFNPDWDKLEASYESWREIAAELLVAKERIAELETNVSIYESAAAKHLERAEVAERRNAELESRTVTVKLPQAVSAGGQGYQAQVERILTAAGIKWEAE
ncbi:TPA: ead/Ea22-like family protein [Klebsiella oxytoca]